MRTALILLLLVALAALLFWLTRGDEPVDTPTAPAVEAAEVEDDASTTSDDPLPVPRFDIVRVDRSGFAVVAGAAVPGAKVDLMANGTVIATEYAASDGNWAISTDTPLVSGPVELTLTMTTPDGMVITGSETVIIYVPKRPGDNPIVLRTTAGGATEVLQQANANVGDLGPLGIESIDYDDSGSVIFAGRAEPLSVVQVFADRSPVGQTTADDQGRWELSATIRPGRYTLQIIQLKEDGAPKYAIEVPFEQATIDDVLLRDGNVVVQPGNSLWVISRRVYGEGAQYTVIYEANEAQIRDPDLIYPGQVFRLPEEDAAQ